MDVVTTEYRAGDRITCPMIYGEIRVVKVHPREQWYEPDRPVLRVRIGMEEQEEFLLCSQCQRVPTSDDPNGL